MAHHAEDPDTEMLEKLGRFAGRGSGDDPIAKQLGATGEYPDGKLTELDKGEIVVATAIVDGRVVLDFGTAVQWVGLTPEQAIDAGRDLIKKGRKALRADK